MRTDGGDGGFRTQTKPKDRNSMGRKTTGHHRIEAPIRKPTSKEGFLRSLLQREQESNPQRQIEYPLNLRQSIRATPRSTTRAS